MKNEISDWARKAYHTVLALLAVVVPAARVGGHKRSPSEFLLTTQEQRITDDPLSSSIMKHLALRRSPKVHHVVMSVERNLRKYFALSFWP